MKYLIFILFTLLIASCSQPNNLTQQDRVMINKLSFDSNLVMDVRNITDSSFLVATTGEHSKWSFKDTSNYTTFKNKNISGIKFNQDSKSAYSLVIKLRDKFRERGYYIYISESNFGHSPDVVTILKTNDKFDVLRFEGTSGINYDITLEDIIDKLSIWDKKYGLKLVGSGIDFLEADYNHVPNDIDAYSKELYAFCPDIVDQGVGSLDALQADIKITKKLYLWWD